MLVRLLLCTAVVTFDDDRYRRCPAEFARGDPANRDDKADATAEV